MAVQEYWESIVFDSGKLANLQPNKQAGAAQWLADNLGQRIGQVADVREPLLNVRRQVDGNLREAGIYNMMGAHAAFVDAVKATGVKLDAVDLERFIEEGLTPQRLAVYGNSPIQQAELLSRYNNFTADMLGKGFDQQQLTDLLDKANGIMSHWDEMRAISLSTGKDVSEMVNIGYKPRIFTEQAESMLQAAGALDDFVSKSRGTWVYLAEDHAVASKLLGVTPAELTNFVAAPGQFAEFLSKNVSDDQLDLLIDSGILSKIPMLGSDVAEYLTLKYKIPLTSAEVFIHDPVAASSGLIRKMERGAQESAMFKYASTEGIKAGWAVTADVATSNSVYSKFVPLSSVTKRASDTAFVHPTVAANMLGLLRIAASPAEMSKASLALKWLRSNFSKQALGNPIGLSVYLSGQILSGMGSTVGRGAGLTDYFTSLMDISLLTTKGLAAFDNVKPFRMLDNGPVTHREFVARTLRMFSHDILPGIDVSGTGSGLLDFKQLSPAYARKQLTAVMFAGQYGGVRGAAGEAGKALQQKADALFLPGLRLASMIDMAGQLAVARGKATLGYGSSKSAVKQADQMLFGWDNTRFSTWEEVSGEVKAAFPMFDDVGNIPRAVSSVAPFSSWAMQNLPLQLRDMLRQPSKWHNYARMTAMWNDSRMGSDTLEAGGMQDWERDKYGLVLHNDPASKQTTMLFHGDFDPRWGSLTWVMSLGPDSSASAKRNDLNGSAQQKRVNALISKTMFAGAYKAISGIDPLTGVKRDDSPIEFEQFGGMNMPPVVASLLSMMPVLAAADRLPIISGTQALLDPRTNAVIKPAVDGWLGNQGKLRPKQLEGIDATLQVLGGRVRVVDRLANMKMTWRDTERLLGTLTKEQSVSQQKLAADLAAGHVKEDSDSYRRRVGAINQMTDAVLQINMDLGRIERWAEANNLPSSEVFDRIAKEKLVMRDMPLPGADYYKQQLDEALKAKWESK
jgi:hypothetical protein